MKLEEFLKKYDHPGSIVLLEGKRKVKPEDKDNLVELGALLAKKTLHARFRSGNANGADLYFSKGVASVDPNRLEVITPYSGHRSKTNLAATTYSLDKINLAAETDVIYQSKKNKKTSNLVDRYVSGLRDRNSIRAAYILRDTIKVLGSAEIRPATLGIFYDDLEDPRSGGTGHTMKVCEEIGIQVIDQEYWSTWL